MKPEGGVASESVILRGIRGADVARLTSDLVKIPTVNPPGREREICEFIASWLGTRGVEASLLEEIPGRTNVQAMIDGDEGGGKTLILNGHTDVVAAGNGWTEDPFGGLVKGGRVYGRGSADMKGGLAAMMVTVDALRKSRKHLAGRMIFQATADEEVGSPMGTGYLVRRGLRGDLAIVGEPTSLEVCVAHKGVLRFDVVAFGKAAHGSVPWEGRSAILAMNVVIDALRGYAAELEAGRRHPLLGAPTVKVGVIQGGVAVNVVPDRCRIVVERRLIPPESVEGAVREVRAVVAGASKRAGVRCEVTFNAKSESSDASRDKEGVQVLLRAAKAVTGEMRKPKGFLATCDARYLNNDAGIPAVVIGPGKLESVHAPDEYVEIRKLEQAARLYALSYVMLQDSGVKQA
jgi:succinyl-diaminopimelate desuccinylase